MSTQYASRKAPQQESRSKPAQRPQQRVTGGAPAASSRPTSNGSSTDRSTSPRKKAPAPPSRRKISPGKKPAPLSIKKANAASHSSLSSKDSFSSRSPAEVLHESNDDFKSVSAATQKVMDQLAHLYPDLSGKEKKESSSSTTANESKAAKVLGTSGQRHAPRASATSKQPAPRKHNSSFKKKLLDKARSASPVGAFRKSSRTGGKDQNRPPSPFRSPGGSGETKKDAERQDREETAAGPNPEDNGLLKWLGFSSGWTTGQLYASEPAPEEALYKAEALGEDDLLAFLDGKTTRADSAGELPTRERQPSEEVFAAMKEDAKQPEEPDIKDFTIECGLGTGGFAAVVLVTQKETNKVFAVKVMNKCRIVRDKQILRIGTERRVLQESSKHPFVSRMHYAFQNDRQLFFVLDFCAGGDLYFHLTKFKNSRFKHFSEEATQFYVAELVMALEHLHNQGIVYRDLKLENVMLDEEGHIKLVDFGLSKENVAVPCDEPLSPCGSILYMAPEMLEMTGGTSVDWWTLGILMHEMLTGHSPWKSETQNAVLKELRDTTPVKLSRELSSRANAIISGFVTRNPRKRLGTRGAAEIKSHPFFWPRLKRSADWKKLLDRQLKPPIRPCRTPGTAAANARASRNSRQSRNSTQSSTTRMNQKKQYGTTNFEKSQRHLAIKAVVFPDQSNEGSVGKEFEGFIPVEGGPSVRDEDMDALKRMMARKNAQKKY